MAADPIYRGLDGRTKILLLVGYTVALFVADSLGAMLALTLVLVVVAHLGGASLVRLVRQGLPSYPIAAFLLAYNLVANGWVSAVLVGVRVVLLVYASLILMECSTPTELTAALQRFMRPLGRCGIPVHEGVTALSIALRFMPLMAEELAAVRAAQRARGAAFDDSGLVSRMRAYGGLMVPMLVGLFRRADRLACAMDARCFGATGEPTSLSHGRLGLRDGGALLIGFAICGGAIALF